MQQQVSDHVGEVAAGDAADPDGPCRAGDQAVERFGQPGCGEIGPELSRLLPALKQRGDLGVDIRPTGQRLVGVEYPGSGCTAAPGMAIPAGRPSPSAAALRWPNPHVAEQFSAPGASERPQVRRAPRAARRGRRSGGAGSPGSPRPRRRSRPGWRWAGGRGSPRRRAAVVHDPTSCNDVISYETKMSHSVCLNLPTFSKAW